MMSLWQKWLNHREQRECWQTSPDIYNYAWLKKTVLAAVIFLVVYELHVTNTAVTPYMDNEIKYILNTNLDISYVTDQLPQYVKNYDLDWAKVKTTLSRPADPLLYMQRPANGKILVPYGWRNDAVLKRQVREEGVTFDASLSDNVTAAAPGTVKIISDSTQYGKIVVIEHGRSIETLYGKLREVLVTEGETVSQGQIIGKVIAANQAPTLYFEVHENGKAIDPLKRLRGETAEGK